MRWNKRRLFKQQVLNCIIILFYELKQLYCDYYLILQYTCNIVYIVKTKGSKPIFITSGNAHIEKNHMCKYLYRC